MISTVYPEMVYSSTVVRYDLFCCMTCSLEMQYQWSCCVCVYEWKSVCYVWLFPFAVKEEEFQWTFFHQLFDHFDSFWSLLVWMQVVCRYYWCDSRCCVYKCLTLTQLTVSVNVRVSTVIYWMYLDQFELLLLTWLFH